jgi:hypothetical protein
MKKSEFLTRRWKAEWSTSPAFARLRDAHALALQAQDAVASLTAKRADLQRPGDLSAKGLNERIRSAAQVDVVPMLRRAAHLVDKARAEIKATRGAMRVQRPDPTDAAGAIRRMDIRNSLRSLPVEASGKLLMDPAVDADLLMAVFEVPAFVSGIPDQLRDSLEQAIIERTNSTELEIVAGMEEAATVVDAGLRIGLMDLRESAGFEHLQEHEFGEWVQSAALQTDKQLEQEDRVGPVVGPADLKATAAMINKLNQEQLDQIKDFAWRRNFEGIGKGALPVLDIPDFSA